MPRPKLYEVKLTQPQKTQLRSLITKGTAKARTITRARILLLAADNKHDKDVVEALGVGHSTVFNIRRRFSQEGLEAALSERPRPGAKAKLDAKQEAFLIALACSDQPDGRKSWTMQLLADRMVELGLVDELSDETVRRCLKKNGLSLGRRSSGASPG